MNDLILDLQENGGGYLIAAVRIANEFLLQNDLIVYTQGLRTERQEYKADGTGRLLDGKVVVLVNEYSASAAEIVTGAIQDHDRDRKSTRLNSSHANISYAVFCLKKKKKKTITT